MYTIINTAHSGLYSHFPLKNKASTGGNQQQERPNKITRQLEMRFTWRKMSRLTCHGRKGNTHSVGDGIGTRVTKRHSTADKARQCWEGGVNQMLGNAFLVQRQSTNNILKHQGSRQLAVPNILELLGYVHTGLKMRELMNWKDL